jgi:hypothetical protein
MRWAALLCQECKGWVVDAVGRLRFFASLRMTTPEEPRSREYERVRKGKDQKTVLLRAGKEVIEVGEHFGGVPLLVADDFAGDLAVAVDDVGFRDHYGAVGFGDGASIFFCRGIPIGGIADRVIQQEFLVGGFVFVGGDTEYDCVMRGNVLLKAIETGRFFDAGLAPRAPEIEDDDLAPQVGEVCGFAIESEREVASSRAGDRGLSLAIAG